jgi:hypothetical protein
MKIFLVGHDYNLIKKQLIKEYFSRQVFWMNKDFKLNHKEQNIVKRLNDTFKASATSNKLYMFLYSLFTKIINSKVVHDLNNNYGLPTQNVIDELKQMIQHVKNNVNNYKEFSDFVNLSDIMTGPIVMINILDDAVTNSRNKGYHKGF